MCFGTLKLGVLCLVSFEIMKLGELGVLGEVSFGIILPIVAFCKLSRRKY